MIPVFRASVVMGILLTGLCAHAESAKDLFESRSKLSAPARSKTVKMDESLNRRYNLEMIRILTHLAAEIDGYSLMGIDPNNLNATPQDNVYFVKKDGSACRVNRYGYGPEAPTSLLLKKNYEVQCFDESGRQNADQLFTDSGEQQSRA